MASKFRLNRYNWFGQKLLVQHEYGEIIRLRQYLVGPDGQADNLLANQHRSRPTSDHLSYIHGLALMKTSTHLDEIIFNLQRLNFDKNNQYFLLLCNCLLYSGNYDSVVALCKQVINKEIDKSIGILGNSKLETDSSVEGESGELLVEFSANTQLTNAGPKHDAGYKRKFGHLDMVAQESFEFRRIFDNINRNHLINEPRLWFTFGLSLDYQRQFKDAHFAFRVAANLASGVMLGPPKSLVIDSSADQLAAAAAAGDAECTTCKGAQVSMSNYYAPHLKFAAFCIKHKGDFRSSIHVLADGRQLCPHNYELNQMLALCISGQPNSNQANFNAAIEIISSLEAHSITNRNPSSGYNRLAIKCMQKLRAASMVLQTFCAREAGDEDRSNLGFLLVKAYVVINSLIQDSGCPNGGGGRDNSAGHKITNQIDKLIESLRNSEPACRVSASLWNNLGLCYLIKRRFVACFSCLSKANQISPLDWRINYNLAAACVHVGLFSKALICLLAAKSLYASSNQPLIKTNKGTQSHPLITGLLAICYEKLDEVNESRRLHIESIRPNGGSQSNMPIISLINYLIFLHKNSDQSDEQYVKLKLHLLDQLEHCWLQRSQNDPQFSGHILETARLIGEQTLANQNQTIKKNYAWTKTISGMESKI